MIPDGPWTAVVLLGAVPAGLGHLCHLILAVNIISGTGYREAVLDRVRLALFSTFWVSSALLLWGTCTPPGGPGRGRSGVTPPFARSPAW